MATTILATGTTAAASAPASLAAGESATLFMTGAGAATVPVDAVIELQFQRTDGNWTKAYTMSWAEQKMTARFDGPVTFRVSRRLSPEAYGVDRA